MKKQEFQITTLPNGLRIATDYLPDAGAISMCWSLSAGSNCDTAERPGTSHFFEHLAGCGHEDDPSFDITQALDTWGASWSFFTGPESTNFTLTCLPRRFSQAIDMVGSMICRPLLTEHDIERERAIIRQEFIRSENDLPRQFFLKTIEESYGSKGSARPVIGTLPSIMHMSRNDLQEYRDMHYRAGNMMVCVSGPIPHDHVVKLTELAFRDVKPGTSERQGLSSFISSPPVCSPSKLESQRIAIIIDIPESEKERQISYVALSSMIGVDLNNYMRNAGYTYDTTGIVMQYKSKSFLRIEYETEPDKAAASLQHLHNYLQRPASMLSQEKYDSLKETEELGDGQYKSLPPHRMYAMLNFFHRTNEVSSYEAIRKVQSLPALDEIKDAWSRISSFPKRIFGFGPCQMLPDFDINPKGLERELKKQEPTI